MSYVDGLVLAVPTSNKSAYKELASKMCAVFLENGASRVVENWGDDVPRGKTTDFWGAVKAEASETVVFTWVEWPSKAVRDVGMAKVMADPRMQPGATANMPFDGKRMIFGGFETLLDAKA